MVALILLATEAGAVGRADSGRAAFPEGDPISARLLRDIEALVRNAQDLVEIRPVRRVGYPEARGERRVIPGMRGTEGGTEALEHRDRLTFVEAGQHDHELLAA